MALLHYDVCVVGSELGGLMAAALLAQKGFSIALFNSQLQSDQKNLEGISLPVSPALILQPSGPFQEVIDRLELRTEMRNSFSKTLRFGLCGDPDFRLILPKSGIAAQKEIVRAFPNDHAQISAALAAFYTQKPSAIYGERTKHLSIQPWSLAFFKKQLSREQPPNFDLNAHHEFGATSMGAHLEKIGALFHYDTNEKLSSSYLGAHFLAHGPLIPANPRITALMVLKQLLLESFERHNGKIIREPIAEIVIKNKAVSLITTQARQNYNPKIVIDAAYGNDFISLMNKDSFQQRYSADQSAINSSLPTMIIRKLLPIRQVPFFYPRLFSVCEHKEAHAAVAAVEVLATADPQLAAVLLFGQLWDKNDVEKQAEELFARIMPGTQKSCVASDFIEGNELHRLWPKFKQQDEQNTGLKTINTAGTNILRVTKDILAKLGAEGEAASAFAAVESATAILNKKRLFSLPNH